VFLLLLNFSRTALDGLIHGIPNAGEELGVVVQSVKELGRG